MKTVNSFIIIKLSHLLLQCDSKEYNKEMYMLNCIDLSPELLEMYNLFQRGHEGDCRLLDRVICPMLKRQLSAPKWLLEKHICFIRNKLPGETIQHYVTDPDNKTKP